MSDSKFKKFNFHKGLADICFEEGDYEEAIFNYSTAIEHCSDNQKKAFCYWRRGSSKVEQSDLSENLQSALVDFNSAIRCDQSQYNYHLDRGKLKFDLGDFRDAIKDLQISLSFSVLLMLIIECPGKVHTHYSDSAPKDFDLLSNQADYIT